MIKDSSAVTYGGEYWNGLSSIPLEKFDVFLFTSQCEGMPNTLLEAAAAGLVLIAPNTGGVGEVVKNKTGYLIDRFDNIEAYINALTDCISHPKQAYLKVGNASKLLSDRHSWEEFFKASKILDL